MKISVNGSSAVTSLTVQEDAIPRDLTDTSGSFGSIAYSKLEDSHDIFSQDSDVSVLCDPFGSYDGVISSVSSSDLTVSVTADGLYSMFNTWKSVPPYSGNMLGYLQMIDRIVGSTVNLSSSVDPAKTFRIPGFIGNVWENLKTVLTAHHVGLRIENVDNVPMIAAYDTSNPYVTTAKNLKTTGWSINTGDTSERVKVNYYTCTDVQNNAAFEMSEPSILTVNANETLVQDITIDGSVVSLNQPVCRDYVPANQAWDGTLGAYCVSGNDGKPIEANRWAKSGGSLSVSLTDDPSVIRVTLHGGSVEEYAPYHIAATAGTSSFYNSLHITGRGMRWEKGFVVMYTGAPVRGDAAEEPYEIDSKFITSYEQAYDCAIRASQSLAGGALTLNQSADKADHGFGVLPGCKIRDRGGFYTFSNVTYSPGEIQYTLISNTSVGDWNSFWGGKTVADVSEWYNELSVRDFNNQPMRDV